MNQKLMNTEDNRYLLTEPQRVIDDEIDLLDLVRVLLKYKWLVFSVTLVAAIIGSLLAFLSSDQYQYFTRVEIGVYYDSMDSETLSLIEPAQVVLDKLKSGYIPKLVYDHEKNNNEKLRNKIQVKAPKNSNIVVLESTGYESEEAKLIGVLSGSVELLLNNHEQRTSAQKKKINTRLSKAELILTMLNDKQLFDLELQNAKDKIEKASHALKDIEDDFKVIQSKIDKIGFEEKLLTEREKILIQRQTEIRNLLQDMDSQRESAVKSTSNANSVMTLMLLDNGRRQLYDQQVSVNNEINIDLKKSAHDLLNKREQLKLKLEQAHRNEKRQQNNITRLNGELTKLKFQREMDIQNQKQTIQALEARLSSIIPTSVILGPARSFKPDSKRALFIALSVMLGLFLSLLIIAVLEMKKKLQETEKLNFTNQT